MEPLPRVVDRYELLGVLGAGAFATVYRARHVHTQQAVALKLLTKATDVERWLGEARAAAAVQHRNVVRVLDCGAVGHDVFIVMELAEGPTLAEVIAREGRLTPERSVGIAIQLLEGLAAAHACGIVHRDVKPPNVLVAKDRDGTDLPKILDFGVSKRLTEASSTLDGTSIGTPAYMAPELFGGAKNADARADVYAVATTLYEMLSGKLPFAARTYEELVVQVATQSPIPLHVAAPHVPSAIAATVDRGLVRDREARWQSVGAFEEALRGALVGVMPPSSHGFLATIAADGLPRHASVHTAPPPPLDTGRHRRTEASALGWVVGVVSVVLLLGIGGAGIAMWRAQASGETAQVPAATLPVTVTEAAPAAPLGVTSSNGVVPAAQPTVATPVASVRPPPHAGGVKFKFPAQIVGQVRATAIDALARHIAPQAERCRPERGHPAVVARVQLFVQPQGTISIAKAASDPGDEGAAACIAALFKDGANPATFSPGGGGIVTVEATLDPE